MTGIHSDALRTVHVTIGRVTIERVTIYTADTVTVSPDVLAADGATVATSSSVTVKKVFWNIDGYDAEWYGYSSRSFCRFNVRERTLSAAMTVDQGLGSDP